MAQKMTLAWWRCTALTWFFRVGFWFTFVCGLCTFLNWVKCLFCTCVYAEDSVPYAGVWFALKWGAIVFVFCFFFVLILPFLSILVVP